MAETLGEKIRNYRLRARMSQMDLELEIGASPGSISRIENNKVKPTRETLGKISNALHLSPREITNLLEIDIFSPEELVKAINTVSLSLDLSTTLQTAVDIMFNLYPNYNGGVIFLRDRQDPNKIFSKTVSRMPDMPKALSMLPKKLQDLYVTINNHPDNFIIKAINFDSNFQSFEFPDFTQGVMDRYISLAIAKLLGFKSGIVIPMKYNEHIIGAAMYTKNIAESFTLEEERILTLLTNQLGIAIEHARLFERVSTEIENLKTKLQDLLL